MPDIESESVRDDVSTAAGGDVEMDEAQDAMTSNEAEVSRGPVEDVPTTAQDDGASDAPPGFITYLSSPIVTLLTGQDGQTVLSAHQALLMKSPYFATICQSIVDDGSPRQIELPDEDNDAVGSFLEFLYTGEYFPRKVPGQRVLETHPSLPDVDDSGEHLLRHARIYTLAEKFGMDRLKKLAASKIHCINSTAKGEISYARYVYANTAKDDTSVRAPIASFWAARSHALRSEAEDEFKSLCLEFPEFGYEVLTRVLDDKLKRERNEKMHPATGSGCKRSRMSSGSH